MPGWLERLGQALPSAIMAVLIVYCLKDAGTDLRGVAFPQFLAVGVVAVTYKWKHQTLLQYRGRDAGVYDTAGKLIETEICRGNAVANGALRVEFSTFLKLYVELRASQRN